MSSKVSGAVKCNRIMAAILVGVSVLLFFFDTQMAIYSMATALLLLLVFGEWSPVTSQHWMYALPCVPFIYYNIIRLYFFTIQFSKTIGNGGKLTRYDIMYFLEVLLLAVTYAILLALIFTFNKPNKLRITGLALCIICVLLGIWDIFDGVWVVLNNPSTAHIKRFFFYYIPDICFWILPFILYGQLLYNKKKS